LVVVTVLPPFGMTRTIFYGIWYNSSFSTILIIKG